MKDKFSFCDDTFQAQIMATTDIVTSKQLLTIGLVVLTRKSGLL